MSLWSEFISNNHGRAAVKPTWYFTAYERHLERFRGRSVTMVEIGVAWGGSLQMWKKYLGPNAQIVGIEIDPEKAYEEPQIAIRIGDQGDPAFLAQIIEEFAPIDIVLDDGSHRPKDIAAAFDALYPALDRNGVYMVEDTGTSYRPDYDGGLGREGTFVESVKSRIDELNGKYVPDMGPTPFTESTLSIHVYPGIVAFERGQPVDDRLLVGRPDKARAEGKPWVS